MENGLQGRQAVGRSNLNYESCVCYGDMVPQTKEMVIRVGMGKTFLITFLKLTNVPL